ncbi:TPA: hypothetical protein SMI17_003514 [Serratia marcescens]|uniref:hypothetical protein n=1 Tax=Serratia marcescens TaxID=615 RepID=UPI0029DEDA2E|nr:hypothetical protein [Serratia marcescens]
MKTENTVYQIFQTARDLPKNYVERPHVDNLFIETLLQQNHIVIYGSSKQGKTSLRKRHLEENDSVVISCLNAWSIGDLQLAILKKVGFSLEDTSGLKKDGSVKLKFKVPFLAEAEVGAGIAKEKKHKDYSINANDTNDVIDVINNVGFEKFIILEDFHYLPLQTQKDFSISLKAYHELSKVCFIIIGVWLENDRITSDNGDLTGRITSINADLWKDKDIQNLFIKSESLLNIQFDDKFKRNLISKSNGNIFLVQKICLKACHLSDVHFIQREPKIVGENISIDDEIKEELENQNARYRSFIYEFSKGFGKTELNLYKWILYTLLKVEREIIENSLYEKTIRETIKEAHPQKFKVTSPRLYLALGKSIELQLKIDIKPIIFEYDENRRKIKIVDKYFILWREYQDLEELYELASIFMDDDSE